MKEVSYNKEILDLIKKLTRLTKQFLMTKDGENVSIRVNCEKSVFVDLETPVSNFDFDGETIGFVEGAYNKFYDFFSSFKKPILKQDQNKLIIQDGHSSIKYQLSNPEIIKNSFKGAKKFPSPIVSFVLSKENFEYIKDMIRMINSENVVFKINKKDVTISVINDVTDNSYDHVIPLDVESTETMEVPLKTTIFNFAPELEYKVNIITGLFHFESVNPSFTLNLYTGMKSSSK